MQLQSWGQEDPMEEGMTTHSLFLPGESHGLRSLAGYSPWGSKELDTTEQLNNNHHSRGTQSVHYTPLRPQDPQPVNEKA